MSKEYNRGIKSLMHGMPTNTEKETSDLGEFEKHANFKITV